MAIQGASPIQVKIEEESFDEKGKSHHKMSNSRDMLTVESTIILNNINNSREGKEGKHRCMGEIVNALMFKITFLVK